MTGTTYRLEVEGGGSDRSCESKNGSENNIHPGNGGRTMGQIEVAIKTSAETTYDLERGEVSDRSCDYRAMDNVQPGVGNVLDRNRGYKKRGGMTYHLKGMMEANVSDRGATTKREQGRHAPAGDGEGVKPQLQLQTKDTDDVRTGGADVSRDYKMSVG